MVPGEEEKRFEDICSVPDWQSIVTKTWPYCTCGNNLDLQNKHTVSSEGSVISAYRIYPCIMRTRI